MNPDTIWPRMAISNATAAHRGFLDLDEQFPSRPTLSATLLSVIYPSLSFSCLSDGGRWRVDPVLVGSSVRVPLL